MKTKHSNTLTSQQSIYLCAGVTFDTHAGVVSKGSNIVRIAPNNMKVLAVLLDNSQQVVSRNQLFEQVWGNQVIADDVLTRCISDLRKQLAEVFNHIKTIETLPKRGYRWTLPLSLNEEPIVIEQAAPKKTKDDQDKTFSFHFSITRLILFLVVGLLLISTSSLWLVNWYLSNSEQKVALIPIDVSIKHQPLADQIEQHLVRALMENSQIKVLAKSAVRNRPQNHFSYLAREFATDWIIEGSIVEQNSQLWLRLNLVDAKSATLSFSQNSLIIMNDQMEKTKSINASIEELTQKLLLFSQ